MLFLLRPSCKCPRASFVLMSKQRHGRLGLLECVEWDRLMARLLPPERDIGVLQAPVRSCLALTGIFLVVLLAVGLLERIGIEPGAALTAIVGAAFALFAACGAPAPQPPRGANFTWRTGKSPRRSADLRAPGQRGLLVIGLVGGIYGSYAEFLLGAAALARLSHSRHTHRARIAKLRRLHDRRLDGNAVRRVVG